MKVAIPHWRGRVSPVFDVAANVLVVDIDHGAERSRREVAFAAEDPRARAARLAETGANVLICGAISWPLETAVAAAGIEVIPQTCGEIEAVLAAFASGRLDQRAFLMPGCCGRRRQFRARRGRGGSRPRV
jgi:predicted Fe-Mo cluster-binding NifX family protein